MWMFWATLTILGFVSSLKKATERTTERYCARRKRRRARRHARERARERKRCRKEQRPATVSASNGSSVVANPSAPGPAPAADLEAEPAPPPPAAEHRRGAPPDDDRGTVIPFRAIRAANS
jgi:hypothetical protein